MGLNLNRVSDNDYCRDFTRRGLSLTTRLLANDGITASLQCALALYICWTLDTTVVNVMIVIALLGFIATLSVARFRKRDGSL